MGILLRLQGISKLYGKNEVLSGVDLEVRAGEIHGLVGENGAGKTTLLKILLGSADIMNSGGYQGSIYLSGRKVDIRNPGQALELGIGMVHQEFALIPDMTIAENVMIGREITGLMSKRMLGSNLARIDWPENIKKTKDTLQKLGIIINPTQPAGILPVSIKQFVELAREISRDNLRLLVVDEPTASLTEDDAARLLNALKGLAQRGIGVILVSHRLEEVTSCCERITVLRNGRVVARFTRADQGFSITAIAEAMIGSSIKTVKKAPRSLAPNPFISFRNFSVDMPGEQLAGLDLDVYKGEILGLAGLVGHGKTALGNGLMGVYPVSGQVILDGHPLEAGNSRAVASAGIILLHEERRETGLLMEQPVASNIVFTAVQQKNMFLRRLPLTPVRLLDSSKVRRYAQKAVQEFDIRCTGIWQPVRDLSGGNQQKVCLARALAVQPRVLIVNEPTRGIDIGGKEMILDALLRINRENGTTIICASSELNELRRISDRIAVFFEGKVFAILSPDASGLEFALAFSGKRIDNGGNS